MRLVVDCKGVGCPPGQHVKLFDADTGDVMGFYSQVVDAVAHRHLLESAERRAFEDDDEDDDENDRDDDENDEYDDDDPAFKDPAFAVFRDGFKRGYKHGYEEACATFNNYLADSKDNGVAGPE